MSDRSAAPPADSVGGLALLFEQCPLPCHCLDPEGRILDVNPAWEEKTGFGRSEAVGQPLARFLTPEQAAGFAERFANFKASGQIRSARLEMLRADGRAVVFLEDGNAGSAREGGSGRTYSLLRDTLTPGGREQEMEERLRSASQMLDAIIKAAPVAIVAMDMDRRPFLFNQAAEQLTGLAAAEVLGRPSPGFLDAQGGDELRERAFRGEVLKDVETGVKRADGTTVEVVLSCSPLRDAEGKMTGVIGVISDITERRRLEAQLEESRKLDSLGRLAGGIAHDFNNLLTVVNGYSDLALRALNRHDPVHAGISQIRSAGERAAELTQQLLAFSRRQILEPKPLDLNSVVAHVGRMCRRLIGENIELITRLEPGSSPVVADPGQIQQALLNLVLNARDAMPGGGHLTISTGRVDLDAEAASAQGLEPGPYVMLGVTDTGAGMDADTVQHLFEPFYSKRGLETGAGLGLPTVFGIVKQSGGQIVVESRPGGGSTFQIYLPRAPGGGEIRAPWSEPVEPARGSETVLVVEDQAEVRVLACEALRSYGYHVLEAGSGAEALRIAGQYELPIHLILADVVMPGLSGVEFLKRIGQTRPDSKMLLMTGHPDAGAKDLPEAPCISKPFTPALLSVRVREILGEPARGRRILLVDDEAAVRRLLRDVLASAGYHVSEAGDGKRALQHLRREPVDVLVTDLVMPEQEGIETIRQVKATHPGLKIIAISGAFGGRFLRMVELLGADATLSKPIRPDVLLTTVARLLPQ